MMKEKKKRERESKSLKVSKNEFFKKWCKDTSHIAFLCWRIIMEILLHRDTAKSTVSYRNNRTVHGWCTTMHNDAATVVAFFFFSTSTTPIFSSASLFHHLINSTVERWLFFSILLLYTDTVLYSYLLGGIIIINPTTILKVLALPFKLSSLRVFSQIFHS